MEEEWAKQNSHDDTEMVIVKELDPSDFEKIQVYDGDLNPMTFGHVKKSKAFASTNFEVEDDLSWLESTDYSTTFEATSNTSPFKRSEDGWNVSQRRTRKQASTLT